MFWPIFIAFQRFAATATPSATANCGNGQQCDTGLPVVAAGSSQLQSILQIVFGVLTALAVMVVVIGGLRLVSSAGNPENAKKARSTIIYAVIGLVVCLSAELVVSFALGHL